MDNFDEFFGAFDAGEQEAAEEVSTAEETSAAEEPAESESETEEAENQPEGGAGEEGQEVGGSEQPVEGGDASSDAQEQSYTVRIGEEDRQYSLQEITELAQKGAGFDDLQARFDATEQSRQQLQEQLDGQQGAMDILGQIAERSGKTIQELIKQMYINFRKSAGASEDAAALELENAQLKKQVDSGKPTANQEEKKEEDPQARGRREITEFKKLHPGVTLTDAQIAKLKPDVQNGMTLANAYQKMLNDQKAAELAERERKAAAAEQNAKNKANSPGSQQDSGGRREKSSFDDFFAQFK